MKTYEGYDGAIELREDHVVLRREGAMAKARGLGDSREIPLAAITGVTLKPATIAVNGHIQLQLGGDPPRNYLRDPNAVSFRRKGNAEFDELADLLGQLVAGNAAQGIDPTSVEFDRGATRADKLREKQATRKDKAQEKQAARRDRIEQLEEKRDARKDAQKNSFAGVTLHDDRIESEEGGGPIAGARAIVDTAGEIDRRVTATRLILTGPLAFGLRKKKDNRELYLLVEGQGWAISKELRPNQGAEARAFAARVNAAGSAQSAGLTLPAAEPDASASSTGGSSDVFGQISRLGELRDQGLITPEEFEAKKAELLERL